MSLLHWIRLEHSFPVSFCDEVNSSARLSLASNNIVRFLKLWNSLPFQVKALSPQRKRISHLDWLLQKAQSDTTFSPRIYISSLT